MGDARCRPHRLGSGRVASRPPRPRDPRRGARPRHWPAAAGAASTVRPAADRELAPAGRHDGSPGAGGEALAAGALVSEHRGARGLVRARTLAPRVLGLGRAREGAGALARSFFSCGGRGAGFNERRCATWSSPSGVSELGLCGSPERSSPVPWALFLTSGFGGTPVLLTDSLRGFLTFLPAP